MAKKADSGGSAFPHNEPWTGPGMGNDIQHSGMSLRDYFAGKAMAGLAQQPNALFNAGNAALVAEKAYLAADAMLAERAKGGA